MVNLEYYGTPAEIQEIEYFMIFAVQYQLIEQQAISILNQWADKTCAENDYEQFSIN